MGDIRKNETDEQFVLVKDMKTVVEILKQRIPKSANMYNAACKHYRYSKDLNFYTLNDEALCEKSWIISVYLRDDYGKDLCISGPDGEMPSEKFKDALINAAPFSWNEPYTFSVIDNLYSNIIYDISIRIKENCTFLYPSYFYYIPTEDAVKLDLNYTCKDFAKVEVKQLSENVDEAISFFLKTWKFSRKNSDVHTRKVLERNESSGVFVNGQLVAANNLSGSGVGLMSQFYTLHEFRNKGLGGLCTKFLMKRIGESGGVPSCGVERHNSRSRLFMESIGLKFSHKIDYIYFTGLHFD